ncbi:PREDICTED: transcription repressor OFP3-like [Nelumbo nucifera]|uniref:Transcription repressor n=2 Tax=Nelumbo nucifera TaxID=4432 RepID=A0A822YUJ6_NELNU|nr:PREDICTED: transcription repressor OFP3-like [Nelumbo nucifera]DAD37764.1 TPA_asm: hypothetical protein HUJ06_008405 [Nelumbo nucifera]
MKWGRKKSNPSVSSASSSSSSSRLSSLSQVFPMSWLSKFKQMSGEAEPQPAKTKRKTKPSSLSSGSSVSVCSRPTQLSKRVSSFSQPEVPDGRTGRRTRVVSELDSDDAFWRLSFRKENSGGKKTSSDLSKSVWYDSDDELEFPVSSRPSCKSTSTATTTTSKMVAKEEIEKFADMGFNIKMVSGSPAHMKILPENGICKEQDDRYETEFQAPQKKKDRKAKNRELRKTGSRILKQAQPPVLPGESVEENQSSSNKGQSTLDSEPVSIIRTTHDENCRFPDNGSRKSHYISSSNVINNDPSTEEENYEFASVNSERIDQSLAEDLELKWNTAKELKIKELLSKSEKQRKSIYISREFQRRRTKQSCKAKVCSPRTPSKVEACKIRALEEMKKTKLREKTKKKERGVEGRTGLENFAVAKCSFDPQKDFRESMMEMIVENQMRRPEELENLLACYLSLNSDEYHDLIIKVFRQVWFELKQSCSGH